MATITNEQIEQKKAQLKQLTTEVDQLINELKEVGAWPLDDDDLDMVTGGTSVPQQSVASTPSTTVRTCTPKTPQKPKFP